MNWLAKDGEFAPTVVRKPEIGEWYVNKNTDILCFVYDEDSKPCDCPKCGGGERQIVVPVAPPGADCLQGLRDAKYLNPRCATDGCQFLNAPGADLWTTLTAEECAAIAEGIEHFILDDNPEVHAIWGPYVDKLQRLAALLDAPPPAQEKK